jgi:hypothetical protein
MLRRACGFALANQGHDTTRAAGLSRSQYPTHRAIYRVGTDKVQGLLVMNRLANEIGWLVIGLAILISVGFVNHFVEQWLQDRLSPLSGFAGL